MSLREVALPHAMLRALLAMPRLTSLCLEQVSLCVGLEE